MDTTEPKLTDFPEYAAALERFSQLQAERLQVESAREALEQEAAKLSSQPLRAALDVRAAELIRGGRIELGAVTLAKKREALAAMREKAALLTRACQMQRAVLSDLATIFSNQICAQLAPEHRELVRDIATKLCALSDACLVERSFRDRLGARNIFTSTLRPMEYRGVGDAGDGFSQASLYLLECYEFGFLELDELPSRLLRHVPPSMKDARAGRVPAPSKATGNKARA